MISRKEPRRILIVGSAGIALEFASLLSRTPRVGRHIIGFMTEKARQVDYLQGLPVLGSLDEAESILSRHVVDEVLIAVPEGSLSRVERLLLFCQEEKITARLACDFLPRGSAKPYLEQLEGVPLLTYATTPKNADLLALKRISDIVLGLGLIYLPAGVMGAGVLLILVANARTTGER